MAYAEAGCKMDRDKDGLHSLTRVAFEHRAALRSRDLSGNDVRNAVG